MGAARFRSWLVIERQSKTSDGGGGYLISWVEVDEVPADLKPIRSHTRGVEAEQGGGRSSMPMVEVTIRADDAFSDLLANAAGYRLRNPETNEIYAVTAAQDFTARNREITITATKGTPT